MEMLCDLMSLSNVFCKNTPVCLNVVTKASILALTKIIRKDLTYLCIIDSKRFGTTGMSTTRKILS
jgi:hypothetical protein